MSMTLTKAGGILRQMREEWVLAGGPLRKDAYGWFASPERVEALQVAADVMQRLVSARDEVVVEGEVISAAVKELPHG